MEISSSRAKKCLGFYSPKYNLPPNLLSLLKCTKVYLFTRKNTLLILLILLTWPYSKSISITLYECKTTQIKWKQYTKIQDIFYYGPEKSSIKRDSFKAISG